MKKHVLGLTIMLFLLFVLATGVQASVSGKEETEPNNTPATANSLSPDTDITGNIEPASDVDYFKIRGVNAFWGIVAFLDTSASGSSQSGDLRFYAPDGTTQLQQDVGGPNKKAVLAWPHFDGRDSHFLRVSQVGQTQSIDNYVLRYYKLSIGGKGTEHAEQEPNNTPATANTAARVNRGVISSASDDDCYAIYGRAGQNIILALNADPENDGGADLNISFYKKNGSLWKQAHRAGPGGNEYIDDSTLPEDGIYTYCVQGASHTGPAATYLIGAIIDGRGYEPWQHGEITWQNARPGNFARVGETMHFHIDYRHLSPLSVPDNFRLYIYYNPDCLDVVDDDHADYRYQDTFGWTYSGISPFMHETKNIVMRAKARCNDVVYFDYASDYYSTSWGRTSYYTIGDGYYLPIILTQ
jgi:hypothetical protein